MTIVGFHGGHSVYELGTASDVALFFECLNTYVAKAHTERDWCVLTDRLYRRYLRQEELTVAADLMIEVKRAFAEVPSVSIEWERYSSECEINTRLDKKLPTLAEVFAKYFDAFMKACRSALSFNDSFKIYQPVKTVISDQPWFLLENQRPLEEYDALDSKPFWLR